MKTAIHTWIKRAPLLCCLVGSGVLLTLGSLFLYLNQGESEAAHNFWEPSLATLFRGLHDGTLWEEPGEGLLAEQDQVEVMLGQQDDRLSGTSAETEADGGKGQEEAEAAEEQTYTFERVTEDYFADAVFIGDSRTVGLYKYAGMEQQADFFCKTSLTIWDVLEKPIVTLPDEPKPISVEEALQRKQYGKVYLMVGINELGRGNVGLFMEQYKKVVARIRELQPDAIFFVEGIMRVAGQKNATDPIFNNANINARNNQIKLLADQKDIFYIDVNDAVCDEEGNLTAEYTFDQIHLKAVYYEQWKQFLLDHGIVREHTEPVDGNDRGKTVEKTRIACVGDSITAGFGGSRYPQKLAGLLGEQYEVYNFGVNGAMAMADSPFPYQGCAAYTESLQNDADVIILMLGTNDSKETAWKDKDTFQTQYEQLVKSYLGSRKMPKLYLCTLASAYAVDGQADGTYQFGVQPAYYEEMEQAIYKVAKQYGLSVIDINGVTAGHPEWFATDGIHPDDQGAEAIAQAVAEKITEL